MRYPSNQSQLGQPVSLDLTRTRREQRLQHDLHRNWKAEGVVLDIPAFISSGTTRFMADTRAKEIERLKLGAKGIISFDSDNADPGPQSYTLPKPKKEASKEAEDTPSRPKPAERDIPPVQPSTSQREVPEEVVDEDLARFLDWAINDDDDEEGELRNAGINRTVNHVERILQALHEAMMDDESVGKASRYKWTKEASKTKIEELMVPLRSAKNNNKDKNTTGKEAEGTSPAAASPSESDGSHSGRKTSGGDQLHAELFEKCAVSASDFLRVFTKLLECYVEPTTDHTLIRKCWGAFELILSVSLLYQATSILGPD